MPLRKYFSLTHTGFTLIEIVVVTSMVGILTGILVLALNPDVFSEESQDTASKATLTKLAEQIEVYRTTENAYPVDSNGDGSVMDEGLSTFLNQWPSNSPQGTTYDYTSNGTSYALKVNKKNNTGCYVYCSLTGAISDYAGNCASVDASCAVSFAPMATPTISVTPTATVTVSPTPSVTPTATVTVSPTPSITPTATVTISPTPTPSPTATLTVFPSVVVSECYVRGCNSELCTNDPGLQSTCGPQSLEMLCLAQAVCEVQPFTGLCGWTYTPEYFACTSGSGGCQSGAC